MTLYRYASSKYASDSLMSADNNALNTSHSINSLHLLVIGFALETLKQIHAHCMMSYSLRLDALLPLSTSRCPCSIITISHVLETYTRCRPTSGTSERTSNV